MGLAGEGEAKLMIAAVAVLCPDCGKEIADPETGACGWTPNGVAHWARQEFDQATAPMCSGCGCFVRVPYPKTLPLAGD
jgi:hypothetical protein